MLNVLIALVVAAVVYWVAGLLGLPFVVCVVAALLVLLAGLNGYDRFRL